MTIQEERAILASFFSVVDHVGTLHLTGGGEPFLHPHLAELISAACEYIDRFDKLMLFTNSTVIPSESLLDTLKRYRDKILVQISHYGIHPEREAMVTAALEGTGALLKIEKYYGDHQSFGGWVDFGKWEPSGRTDGELETVFKSCSVTSVLKGNWRTRDGKVHWCSRSQRGMDLGLIPDHPADYVDLFDASSISEKREKFKQIAQANYLFACNYCSGDAGTSDMTKRFAAAEQM